MSWRCLQDKSSKNLQDMSQSCLPDILGTNNLFIGKESIFVSNKSKFVHDQSLSNKAISDKSKANPTQIRDALIRAQ